MKRWALLLLPAAFVLSYNLGSISYLETSEARYAEIAREMVESGDYVTPRLTYIKHFHKPPLTYWFTSLAFKVFGVNNLSGRVFLVLASLGILVLNYKLARLLFPDNQIPLWSTLILFSSPLYLVMSRTLTTDLYLFFFTTGAVYFLWKWYFETRKTIHALLSGVFLGGAILAKGPVPLIFYLLPWMVFLLFHRQKGKVRIRDLCCLSIIPLIINLPWIFLVVRENPGLIDYFVKSQTLDRVSTTVHRRGGPVYYHLGVLFVGMLFWFSFFLGDFFRSVSRWKTLRSNREETLLICFSIVPLLFFTLSQSKLIGYMLPALPFFALLTAYYLIEKFPSSGSHGGAHVLNGVLLGSLGVAASGLPIFQARLGIDIHPLLIVSIVALVLASLLAMASLLKRRRGAVFLIYAGFNIALFLLAMTVLPQFREEANSFEGIAERVENHASGEYDVITFNRRLPSLTFYTGRRVIQIPHHRETQFEDEDSRALLEEYLSTDQGRVLELARRDKMTFLIISKRRWRKLSKRFPELEDHLVKIYENRRDLLYCNM
ncbi:glycosyltransferase family 39 protein [bacterium]|nr:glycosyltransferase family 39 protein [bacterium]